LTSLSFHASAHSRVLPSFPTRRSSDQLWCWSMSMAPWVSNGPIENAMDAVVSSSWTATPTTQGKPPPPYSGSNGTAPQPESTYRSEEHTSELQSRGHLVCRLLLEKKNK